MKYQNLLIELARNFGTDGRFRLSAILPLYSDNYSHAQGDLYRLIKLGLIRRIRLRGTGLRGKQYAYAFTAWGKKYLKWILTEKPKMVAQQKKENLAPENDELIKEINDLVKLNSERENLILRSALSKNPNNLELSKLTWEEIAKYERLRNSFNKRR